RSNVAWHGTLSEMGLVVVSSTFTVGPIKETLVADGQPTGDAGKSLERSFPRFAADLEYWAEAAKRQRAEREPPY
ncbi:MAG: NADPH-dependent FMN reductase, partial [Sphingobium sp.]